MLKTPASRVHGIRFLAIGILVALLSTGCSTRKAVRLTEKVTERSRDAISLIEKWKRTEASRAEAETLTREVLRKTLRAHQELLLERTKLQMHELLFETRKKVETAIREETLALALEYLAARKEIGQAVEKGFAEATAHQRTLENEMIQRAAEFEKVKSDRDRYDGLVEAEGRYTRFSAGLFKKQMEIQTEYASALDEPYRNALSRISEVRAKKLSELADTYTKSVTDVAVLPVEIDLGPGPSQLTPAHDAMIEYCKAVISAQESLKDYIEVSTWNPFRNSLVKSFSKGLFKGVGDVLVRGKGAGIPTWEDLSSEFSGFGSDVLNSAKADLSEASSGALAEIRGLAKDALAPAVKKLTETIRTRGMSKANELVENARKAIGN